MLEQSACHVRSFEWTSLNEVITSIGRDKGHLVRRGQRSSHLRTADRTVRTAGPAGRAARRANQVCAVDRLAAGTDIGNGELGQDR